METKADLAIPLSHRLTTLASLHDYSIGGRPSGACFVDIATDHAISVFNRISRTFQGISDTSTSKLKLPLLCQGEELAQAVEENFRATVPQVVAYFQKGSESADELTDFMSAVNLRLNEGIRDPRESSIFRHWETEFHVHPRDIHPKMAAFSSSFLEALQDPDRDSVATAGWIEKRVNFEIHPYSDACGRTSKAISVGLLAADDTLYPEFTDREDYFEHANSPLAVWTQNYRSKIPASLTAL